LRRRAPCQMVVAVLVVLLACAGCDQQQDATEGALAYSLMTEITVEPGKYVPGTGVQFLDSGDRGAHVLINGQEAWKRVGDSLDWSGELTEGVTSDFTLRIVSHSEEALHLFGTVKIEVEDPQPQPTPISTTSPVTYSGLVGYGVAKGAAIPGSTVRYLGRSEQGAELSGVEGFPYRKVGDAIDWEGTLAPETYISLQVRLVQFDDEAMRVAGLVRLWFGS